MEGREAGVFQAVAFATQNLAITSKIAAFMYQSDICMNSLVWELASVRLEKALTSYCVCVCMWADIINTGVNDNFFSHSTGSWIESLLSESLLRNHRFKQNDLLDLLCYEYWQIYTSAFLRQHSVLWRLYILYSYSQNTEIN